MSDVMLLGVLRMRYDATDMQPIQAYQLIDRAREAADRIEALQAEVREMAMQYLATAGQAQEALAEVERLRHLLNEARGWNWLSFDEMDEDLAIQTLPEMCQLDREIQAALDPKP